MCFSDTAILLMVVNNSDLISEYSESGRCIGTNLACFGPVC